jgi:hypothetical protein
VVIGTLTSTGDIQIDGRVDGDIRSGSVTIGEKANFEGEIVAEECTIRGRVQGIVRARKVHLSGTCHMEGTILHESLAVEIGAFFAQLPPQCGPAGRSRRQAGTRASFDAKRDLGTQSQISQPVQPAAGIFGRPGTTCTMSTGSLLAQSSPANKQA